MLGDYVRDKDAVSASVELTEMAAWYASQGMTLYDALQALFEKMCIRDRYNICVLERLPVGEAFFGSLLRLLMARCAVCSYKPHVYFLREGADKFE